MQPPYDHYPEFAEPAPPPQEIVPYDPNFMDKASRLMGRISMGARGGGSEEYVESEFNPRPLPYLLDSMERRGLTGDHAVLDVQSPAGHELADSFMKGTMLDQQVFIKTDHRLGTTGSRRMLTLQASEDKPIWLPTSNFISAPGIDEWGGKGRMKGEMFQPYVSSKGVIRSNVRRGVPIAPIPYAVAYVQPDGRALYSVIANGAHRAATAVARGDKAIAISDKVLVRRLYENILPPAQRK